ncbi:DoxX family protein [Chromatocurvus halotolerans]|uniref:Putative membrane protein YphA (DoxX/SURF4 family) n=1 Tax=Chromatocurvus halotolerans TaxID=1132028 RepID=A0A4R2L5E7_9GAMM|nr:DoxX family protein [Chromatocurvus halotolerans]TCO77858.1 putative membrane protein YphA (DoxX/SURF4 family) [Chromatocurvus halotolerans]
MITTSMTRLHDWLNMTRQLDFLAPLLLRLYLGPVFISAGINKLVAWDNTVAWFGNADWGLGLPLPGLMAFLAVSAELVGGFLLILGLATRYIAIPLMITMLVAAFSVHWENGWFAIAPSDPSTSMAKPLAGAGIPGAQASLENSEEVGRRLDAARSLLREHGNYGWLTGRGTFVVLNNGIEFAATYFIMLLSLFFTGAGRYVSLDYWFAARFLRNR